MADEREIFRILGRLEAKSDALHEDIRGHISSDAVFHTALEQRVRELEEARAKSEGGELKESEITGRFNIPVQTRPSFPPKWIREVLGHAITKGIALLLAGGGIGALLRSLLH